MLWPLCHPSAGGSVTASVAGVDGGTGHGLAALQAVDGRGVRRPIRAGSIRSRSCRTGSSSTPTRPTGAASRRHAGAVTLADAQVFNEILRALGHARSDAFIRAGATAAARDPRAGHLDLPRRHAELRLPAARQRRAGPAGDDRPDRRRLPRADPVRRRADRHPHRHRPEALGRAGGSPGEDLRAALSAAQDSRGCARGWAWFDRKTRRGAPARLPPAVRPQVGAGRRGPARAALPAEGLARHRAPAPAPRRCCAGPIRSSARSRRASSSRSPRRPRSSRR